MVSVSNESYIVVYPLMRSSVGIWVYAREYFGTTHVCLSVD